MLQPTEKREKKAEALAEALANMSRPSDRWLSGFAAQIGYEHSSVCTSLRMPRAFPT